jgi:methionine aminopeptidase
MAITLKNQPEDLEGMRVAGKLAADVLAMLKDHVKPGVTTEELDRLAYEHIVNVQKAIPANVGYHGFPKTLCTSVNHVICHGIPNEGKVLKDGDIVNLDVTVIKDGWHGDTSRMYFVGTPSVLAKRLVDTTFEAMMRGIKAVRPGATLGDVGHAIQQHAEAAVFQRGARILRPRHRQGLSRRAAGPALRQARCWRRIEEGHDLHHRADDQRRQAADQAVAGRLDRGDQGSFAVGTVGTHHRGHGRWFRDTHGVAGCLILAQLMK